MLSNSCIDVAKLFLKCKFSGELPNVIIEQRSQSVAFCTNRPACLLSHMSGF